MKSDLHWNQSRDQNWHRRLETYLEQYRIMNGYQAAHMILQDTDWIKRVYCISRREPEETTKDLIRQLRERGFQDDAEVTEEVPVQQDKLTIAISKESLTDTALENLQKIIANKQMLFQRTFRTDSTEVEITEEKINFIWFPYTMDSDEIAAYTQFISRLCDMARDAKRVSSKPTETDNDKYAFRCFLLRLGFIGKEYKTARKILLRNLTGNSAFRYGE